MLRKPRKHFSDFYEKIAGIKCHKNSKIKMSRKFKIANYWKGRKTHLKMHLTEQKSCNLLLQHRNNIQNVSKVRDEECKKRLLSHFKWRQHFTVKNKRKKQFFKKGKCRDRSENKLSREEKL